MATGRPRTSGHVWLAAQAFFDAAELVWKSGELARLSGPLIVNYAFSAELSLKAAETKLVQPPKPVSGLIPVAIIKSEVGRVHALDKVFAALQPITQADLAGRFDAITGEELRPLLSRCSSYFTDARYSFETKALSFGLTDVRTLASGLLQAVREFGLHNGT